MPATRREFLRQSAAFAAGVGGLQSLLASPAAGAFVPAAVPAAGYGPLVADPQGLLDLPAEFAYRVISRQGDRMDDGLVVPDKPDGMATFAGPDGRCIVMRNHELSPKDRGAFASDRATVAALDQGRLYDLGGGETPGMGGVTTIVYDTAQQRVERQFLRLGGTTRNCSGGPTPWGSWITCEETVDAPGNTDGEWRCDQAHGFAFDVPASAEPGLVKAEPLRAMGRFRREAVAIDPETGAVFQTEDMNDGCLYRFVPTTPGNLAAGGRLQALAVAGRPSLDSRNWPNPKRRDAAAMPIGEPLDIEWIDLDDVEAPKDDLRYRAFKAGATRFARGEGIWWADGAAYFACTSGGREKIGQLFRLTPGRAGGADTLELFLEPNDSSLIHNADNLTAAPWGDLIVCEDRQGPEVRLVGVTPEGGLYTFADNHTSGEFAGVCFSPDGSTLFVNIQHKGLTLAITGPWRG